MNEFYNKMEYFEQTEGIPKEIYYHYTSLDALYSIVSSKTFRLTSLKSSNDIKELYYTPDMFLDDLKNIIAKENDYDMNYYFKIIEESIDLNIEAFRKGCKKRGYPYALCLSEKRDNLTHWDRYAVESTGVCICLNVSAIKIMMQRLAIKLFGICIYDIGKVSYDSGQTEKNIRRPLSELVNAITKQSEKNDNDIIQIIQNNGYLYAISAYIIVSKFIKDNSFIDEDEIRLYHDSNSIRETLHLIESIKSSIDSQLYTNLKKNFKEFVNQLQIEDEKFCMTSRGIRSYKELCLEEVWGSGTIPEIILGPLCVQNKSELKRFLKANGLEGTKVTISSVPIR